MASEHMISNEISDLDDANAVAIIGMAGRFPDARNIEEFWRNIRAGVESLRDFSTQELLDSGVAPGTLENPDYVRRGTVVPDVDCFDEALFGFTPRDAEITDPQQRVFMEVAWEALEHAGYDPSRYEGSIGMFGGASSNSYFLRHILGNARIAKSISGLQVQVGNEKDFLCTRAAYHLGLRGPTMTVQTACSTSLVAVHLACQSLLNGECEMAMAGGVSLQSLPKGYLYQPGGNLSSDGRCWTFDERASGTVPGEGAAIVVLKSLRRALEDEDTIHAVIRGSAVNNDGADKVGFSAPSVHGQSAVVAEAMAMAGVEPESICCIEAHGTGTMLGDPIEIKALQQAFTPSTRKTQFCAIGSLKTNIGHLDVAAGVAGLIKAALMVREHEIPPSLNFARPNPHINFERSPFYVNTELQRVERQSSPMRVGVSSFGIGGTNAHAIVEQSPPRREPAPDEGGEVVVLSAGSEDALHEVAQRLKQHLEKNPQTRLRDVAHTLQVGRRALAHRRALLCDSTDDLVRQLTSDAGVHGNTGAAERQAVIFMFPGQGSQYPKMAESLYRREAIFRTELDRCAAVARAECGFDLRTVLFGDEDAEHSAEHLRRTEVTQPVLFAVEYALARQMQNWGVQPDAMLGHSLGEYVAACLAGVFSLEDALMLVARRGRMIASLPNGKMLAVRASQARLKPFMNDRLWFSAVNAPELCSVAGEISAIDALEATLLAQGIEVRPLKTSHAFHSGMMDPAMRDFAAMVSRTRRDVPRLPFVSNVTGTWITPDQASSVDYWCRHLREEVLFSESVQTLLQWRSCLFVEVGPGRSLSTLVAQNATTASLMRTVNVLPEHALAHETTWTTRRAMATLWTQGLQIDWSQLRSSDQGRRIPLPGYPFARRRHSIRMVEGARPAQADANESRQADPSKWFYVSSWQRLVERPRCAVGAGAERSHLVFANDHGCEAKVVEALKLQGEQVIQILCAEDFGILPGDRFEINPADPRHYNALFAEVVERYGMPWAVTHCWNLTSEDQVRHGGAVARFVGMRMLASAIGSLHIDGSLAVNIVSNGVHAVTGDEMLVMDNSVVHSPAAVLSIERMNVRTRHIDLALDDVSPQSGLHARLARELASPIQNHVIAFRGTSRWIPIFLPGAVKPVAISPPTHQAAGRHYLVTEGLGEVGYAFALGLAARARNTSLTLTGSSPLPPVSQWAEVLQLGSSEHAICRAIRQLQTLQSTGCSVQYLAADFSDRRATHAMAEAAVAAFGPVHGIVRAPGQAAPPSTTDGESVQHPRMLELNVQGTMMLREEFDPSKLEFFVLCSALDALAPFAGQAEAAAVDAFHRAFAEREFQRGATSVVATQWSCWKAAGERALAALRAVRPDGLDSLQALVLGSIAPEDIARSLDHLLTMGGPATIVSPVEYSVTARHVADIHAATRQWRHETLVKSSKSLSAKGASTTFDAPRNEVEKALVGIWEKLFGSESIGIHDDFFALGGHSLMATQVLSHVRDALQVTLPLQSIFKATTIAALAVEIDAIKAKEESDRLNKAAAAREAMQRSLDAMSPEQIAALLAEKRRQRAAG